MISAVRFNGQKGGSINALHRACQSTKEDLAIHCNQHSLQLWWLIVPLDLDFWGWESGIFHVQWLPHFKKILAQVLSVQPICQSVFLSSFPRTCSDRRVVKLQVKVITGCHSHKPTCRQSLGQWLPVSIPRPEEAIGSIHSDWAAIFRTALSTLAWGKELVKVPQTLPALPHQASLPQLADHPTSSQIKLQRKPQKTKSSFLEPGMSKQC